MKHFRAIFCIGQPDIIFLLQQYNQFQGINGIQADTFYKKGLVITYICRFKIF